MNKNNQKPYMLHVAEVIYLEILNIKEKENVNNIEAIANPESLKFFEKLPKLKS